MPDIATEVARGTGRQRGESGSRTWNAGEVIPTTPELGAAAQLKRGEVLAQRVRVQPSPCVLHVRSIQTLNTAFQYERSYSAGNENLARATNDYGWLLLTWTDLQLGEQVLVFDMRPGSYPLPPCTHAAVYAGLWSVDGVVSVSASVSVAFSDGECVHGARPTFTAEGSLAAGAAVSIRAGNYLGVNPGRARWFDVWAVGWNGLAEGIGTVGAPILRASGVVGAGLAHMPFIERNYTTGLFTPGWGPVEVANASSVWLRNDGPADVSVCARFWLELG